MTIPQLLQVLKDVQGDGHEAIRLNPIGINENDGRAAELLEWLYAKYPDITVGDLLDLLSAATWWTTTFASMQPRTLRSEEGG
jgi:hypothetical protein